ncbi:MAG: carbohydrate ABC transporter permease [Eubacteriales bacterium]|nr:carbohydrate ABC transporter permease [Eubacteriales bacterium]MDY5015310.1 carbohydrate ABC transporter permease [Eubacteriales bacterium]
MSINRETTSDRVFGICCYVFATILMLIVLYPLWYIVICSVSDPYAVGAGKVWLWPVGFNVDGYARVFRDKNIMTGYGNTIFYTVTGTLLNLTLTLTAAYALSKKTLPGRGIIMAFVMFTMYFSGGLIPMYLQIKNMHLLNTRIVMIILGAVSVYNLIISRTFFLGLPKELEEAAMIDGAGVTRTFIQIVLPLSKALIGVMVLYYGIGHWNSYFNAMIYISDESKMPLQLFLRRILILENMSEDMSGGIGDDETKFEAEKLKMLLKYAVIIVSSAPVLIIYPFLQKYFDKGVLLGSVKG